MNTDYNVRCRIFVTGISAEKPLGQNFGFNTGIEGCGNLSLKYFVLAYGTTNNYTENTKISMFNINYLVFEQETLQAQSPWNYVLLTGLGYTGCFMTNDGSCDVTAPTTNSISNMGSPFLPTSVFFGFTRSYSNGSSLTSSASFNVSQIRYLTDQKYQFWVYWAGNSNNHYQFSLNVFILQTIYCAGAEPYLTRDLTKCNSTCNDGIGQYPDSQGICRLCGSLCYTCQITADSCTGCYTTAQMRILNGSDCVCKNGTYDDTVNIVCQPCHYSCLTCNWNLSSSCQSCQTTVRKRYFEGNSCPCIQHYYNDGVSPNCNACHYSCLNCTAAGSSSCINCDISQKRVISVQSCICLDGFYDDMTNSLCQPCYYQCLTCKNGTGCLTCDLANGKRSLVGSLCPCVAGYYEIPLSAVCQQCHATCATCNGPLATNCVGCDIVTQYRSIVSGSCVCIAHYYENSGICMQCDFSCGNCTGGSSNECTTCLAGSKRQQIGATCQCKVGFYEAGVPTCASCHYSCYSCTGTSTNCTGCLAGSFRTMAGNTCPCNPGYVDVIPNAICSKCWYSCLTCSGTLSSQCLSCDASRILVGGSCLCLNGTYDDGANSLCVACHYSCQNCTSASAFSCGACRSTDQRTLLASKSCACLDRFYDVGQSVCLSCSYQCLTCSQSATNCTSCSAADFRYPNGTTCLCQGGYYENMQQQCQLCLQTCDNCTMYSICTSCNASEFRTLVGGSCLCQNGYFDSGTACTACSVSCLTCSLSMSNCTSCSSSNYRIPSSLVTGLCICQDGYYDAGVAVCQSCQYSCLTCSGGTASDCLTCPSTRNSSSGTCPCNNGLYDISGNPSCQPCHYSCLTCSAFSVCTGCNITTQRQLSSGSCNCLLNYFDGGSAVCQPCHFSCLTCSNNASTSCLTCSAANKRQIASTSCECMNGFFEQEQPSCSPCSSSCLSCSQQWDNCTSCVTGRTLASGTCLCQIGYFDDGSGFCMVCSPVCLGCQLSSTNCISCKASQLKVLEGNACVCMAGSYNSGTSCLRCNISCQTCSSVATCDSCNSSNRRELVAGKCVCQQTFYDNNVAMCASCHISCRTCIGPSEFNCTGCYSNATLFTSMCQLNINCTGWIFDGRCVTICPNISYPFGSICLRCTTNCKTCISQMNCTSCQSGYYLQKGLAACVSACSPSQYSLDSVCMECPANCVSCLYVNQMIQCTRCQPGLLFYNHTCVDMCPVNIAISVNGVCLPCVQPCLTCTNLSSQGCLSCIDGYFMLLTSCVHCPSGMYGSHMTGFCEFCPQNCSVCQQSACEQCVSGMYVSNGRCVGYGKFFDGQVKDCHPNCKSCTNSSFSSCIACKDGRGDNNMMAVRGFCDCRPGSMEMGNGVCSQQLSQKLNVANGMLMPVAAASTATFAAVSILNTNGIALVQHFMTYCQLVSQLKYVNASMPADLDNLLNTLSQFNLMSILSIHMSSQQMDEHGRLMYEQSIQTNSSLYLHMLPQQAIRYFLYLALAINAMLLFLIVLLQCFSKCCRQSTANKLLRYILKLLKWDTVYMVIYMTTVEVMTVGLVAILLGQDIVISIILALYYVFMVGWLFYKALKNDVVPSMASQFRNDIGKIHRIYTAVGIVRNMVVSVLLIVVAMHPVGQMSTITSIQSLFLIYTLFYSPYTIVQKYLVLLKEAMLLGQVVGMLMMIRMEESDRLRVAIAIMAMCYGQILIILVRCVYVLIRTIVDRVRECRKVSSKVMMNDEEKAMEKSSESDLPKDNITVTKLNPTMESLYKLEHTAEDIAEAPIPMIEFKNVEVDKKVRKRYRHAVLYES